MTIAETVGQLASRFLDKLVENDEFSEARMKQSEESLAISGPEAIFEVFGESQITDVYYPRRDAQAQDTG